MIEAAVAGRPGYYTAKFDRLTRVQARDVFQVMRRGKLLGEITVIAVGERGGYVFLSSSFGGQVAAGDSLVFLRHANQPVGASRPAGPAQPVVVAQPQGARGPEQQQSGPLKVVAEHVVNETSSRPHGPGGGPAYDTNGYRECHGTVKLTNGGGDPLTDVVAQVFAGSQEITRVPVAVLAGGASHSLEWSSFSSGPYVVRVAFKRGGVAQSTTAMSAERAIQAAPSNPGGAPSGY